MGYGCSTVWTLWLSKHRSVSKDKLYPMYHLLLEHCGKIMGTKQKTGAMCSTCYEHYNRPSGRVSGSVTLD